MGHHLKFSDLIEGLDQSTVSERQNVLNQRVLDEAGIDYDRCWAGRDPFGMEGGVLYGTEVAPAGSQIDWYVLWQGHSHFRMTTGD